VLAVRLPCSGGPVFKEPGQARWLFQEPARTGYHQEDTAGMEKGKWAEGAKVAGQAQFPVDGQF